MTGSPAYARVNGPARLLFVHAHPDDETLTTGITMAAYARLGHQVHVLTCTLGEEGEVIPTELAHLASGRDDILGAVRRQELRAAMEVLGVRHAVLGEDPDRGVASRYRDSGMAGTPSARHPDAFARADVREAAALVVAHVRDLRPHVVVTYDRHGGYAHPDHVQTHRVTVSALGALTAEAIQTTEATEAAAAPVKNAGGAAVVPVGVDRVPVPAAFCILTPMSWAVQDRAWLHHNVPASSKCVVPQRDSPYPPSVVDDNMVTHVVDEPTLVDRQSQALAEHRTQVSVYDGFYALSNRVAHRLSGREGFARLDLATGDLVPAAHGAPRHTDLLTALVSPR